MNLGLGNLFGTQDNTTNFNLYISNKNMKELMDLFNSRLGGGNNNPDFRLLQELKSKCETDTRYATYKLKIENIANRYQNSQNKLKPEIIYLYLYYLQKIIQQLFGMQMISQIPSQSRTIPFKTFLLFVLKYNIDLYNAIRQLTPQELSQNMTEEQKFNMQNKELSQTEFYIIVLLYLQKISLEGMNDLTLQSIKSQIDFFRIILGDNYPTTTENIQQQLPIYNQNQNPINFYQQQQLPKFNSMGGNYKNKVMKKYKK